MRSGSIHEIHSVLGPENRRSLFVFNRRWASGLPPKSSRRGARAFGKSRCCADQTAHRLCHRRGGAGGPSDALACISRPTFVDISRHLGRCGHPAPYFCHHPTRSFSADRRAGLRLCCAGWLIPASRCGIHRNLPHWMGLRKFELSSWRPRDRLLT